MKPVCILIVTNRVEGEKNLNSAERCRRQLVMMFRDEDARRPSDSRRRV